jgi:hypothetical protein
MNATTNIVKFNTYRRPAVTNSKFIPGRIMPVEPAAVICLQTVRTKRTFRDWLPKNID